MKKLVCCPRSSVDIPCPVHGLKICNVGTMGDGRSDREGILWKAFINMIAQIEKGFSVQESIAQMSVSLKMNTYFLAKQMIRIIDARLHLPASDSLFRRVRAALLHELWQPSWCQRPIRPPRDGGMTIAASLWDGRYLRQQQPAMSRPGYRSSPWG